MGINIGKTLRQARETSGISLKIMGEMLNLSPNTVAAWERDERNPTFSHVVSYLWHCDVESICVDGPHCISVRHAGDEEATLVDSIDRTLSNTNRIVAMLEASKIIG